ncbi:MAG: GNAT family N-acetyltransferase [Muribaculaceae bacterium]|nr:GNAT family N-acetyltransferase [Muribaculaceae bacterium]
MIEMRKTRNLPELLSWRKEVIEHVFGETPGSDLLKANENYYEQQISLGLHEAFIASFEGKDAGCGAICYSFELPSPDNPSGKCAYLMNIYVREPFRAHGIGHCIVSHLIDEARKSKCGKIYLETTEEGRRVYASLGFRDMKDMMKLYDTEHQNN